MPHYPYLYHLPVSSNGQVPPPFPLHPNLQQNQSKNDQELHQSPHLRGFVPYPPMPYPGYNFEVGMPPYIYPPPMYPHPMFMGGAPPPTSNIGLGLPKAPSQSNLALDSASDVIKPIDLEMLDPFEKSLVVSSPNRVRPTDILDLSFIDQTSELINISEDSPRESKLFPIIQESMRESKQIEAANSTKPLIDNNISLETTEIKSNIVNQSNDIDKETTVKSIPRKEKPAKSPKDKSSKAFKKEQIVEVASQNDLNNGVSAVPDSPSVETKTVASDKSKVLMNFLKSHSKASSSDETKAPVISKEAGVLKHLQGPPGLSSPNLISQHQTTAQTTSVDPLYKMKKVDISSLSSGKIGESEAVEKQETPSASSEEKIQVSTKSHLPRSTKNQVGRIGLSVTKTHVEFQSHNIMCRPYQRMTVHWQMPYDSLSSEPESGYVLGLTRYGSSTNSPCIVAKSIGERILSPTNSKYFIGKVSFFTPRSAGRFVYRLFDQSSSAKCVETLATSVSFQVELDEANLNQSLTFIRNLFNDKKDKNSSLKALNQLSVTVNGIRAHSLLSNTSNMLKLLNNLVNSSIELIDEHGRILDESMTVKSKGDSLVSDQSAAKSQLEKYGLAKKIHHEVYNLFQSLESNGVVWPQLDRDLKQRIQLIGTLYCYLLRRYFKSIESLVEARYMTFDFYPAHIMHISSSRISGLISKFNTAIVTKATSLFPGKDFEEIREKIRRNVESSLLAAGIVPKGTEIDVYGSSRNNFGNDSADVDMSVVFPRQYPFGKVIEEKGLLMERIGKQLESIGMQKVIVIPTARIPVVTFQDPTSGSILMLKRSFVRMFP